MIPKLKYRLGALALCCILILLFCGCEKDDPKELTLPTSSNVVSAPNANNAVFSYTLEEFTEAFNKAVIELSEDKKVNAVDGSEWELIGDGLVDYAGDRYASYAYVTDEATFTAAVEKRSGKVFNLAVGCLKEKFEDESFRKSVTLTASLMAMVAGDYPDESLELIYSDFTDAQNNDEVRIDGSLELSYSEDETSVILTVSAIK